jgi:hypothetical protein
MTNLRLKAFEAIIQEISNNANYTEKSVLLKQIEKYSVGDNIDLPKYVPHCNIHKVHKSFMKRQGTSLENEDDALLGSDVWYNGKDWNDSDS